MSHPHALAIAICGPDLSCREDWHKLAECVLSANEAHSEIEKLSRLKKLSPEVRDAYRNAANILEKALGLSMEEEEEE